MFPPIAEYARLHDLADHGRWDELTAWLLDVEDAAAQGGPEQRERVELRDRIARVIVGDGPREAAAWTVEHRYAVAGETWLTDVLASVRTWDEIDPFLTERWLRVLVAHGRVMRGDDLTAEPRLDPSWGLGVPFALEPWEAAAWDPDGFPWDYSSRNGSCRETPYMQHVVHMPLQVTADPGPPLEPVPYERAHDLAFGELFRMRGTAAEALSRHLHVVVEAYAREPHWSNPPEGHASAVGVGFPAAYPLLVSVLGGTSAYGPPSSDAQGRLAVWRLLGRMAGMAEPLDPRAVAAFVARLDCLTWQYHYPHRRVRPLYAAQLVVADPVQGIAWLLDGESDD
ncbi:hypothetical protein [Yinghuangia seranimata]|uniref:hypothetical protein n=1 Tax=Yinghuangia seranimata TaxID=408067 RepID=UPI00248C0154|nr:hypothetical protein [Yinghuangia seranimata]MDI2129067.1 hypothetical protein [Yinghuangia seranimata]